MPTWPRLWWWSLTVPTILVRNTCSLSQSLTTTAVVLGNLKTYANNHYQQKTSKLKSILMTQIIISIKINISSQTQARGNTLRGDQAYRHLQPWRTHWCRFWVNNITYLPLETKPKKKKTILRWHMGKCAENTASKLNIGRWGWWSKSAQPVS